MLGTEIIALCLSKIYKTPSSIVSTEKEKDEHEKLNYGHNIGFVTRMAK